MTEGLEVEVIARGLAIRGNTVLLCKNLKHGYHYLPGGHVEFGETSPTALAREFQEEAGIAVSVGSLAHIHEHIFRQGRRVRHELNLMFHVEQLPEQVTSQESKIAFEWADLSTIANMDIRPEAARQFLLRHPHATIRWDSEALT